MEQSKAESPCVATVGLPWVCICICIYVCMCICICMCMCICTVEHSLYVYLYLYLYVYFYGRVNQSEAESLWVPKQGIPCVYTFICVCTCICVCRAEQSNVESPWVPTLGLPSPQATLLCTTWSPLPAFALFSHWPFTQILSGFQMVFLFLFDLFIHLI